MKRILFAALFLLALPFSGYAKSKSIYGDDNRKDYFETSRERQALADSVGHARLFGLGLNCATGPELMADSLRTFSESFPGFVTCHPNAGLPDEEGRYLAFGGNAAKVGTRVQDIPGIDGAGLLQTIIAQARYEPGWVEYDITNPVSGQVQTKMSYVQMVDDLFVGCGVYKNLLVTSA